MTHEPADRGTLLPVYGISGCFVATRSVRSFCRAEGRKAESKFRSASADVADLSPTTVHTIVGVFIANLHVPTVSASVHLSFIL